jgi:nicotinate-nucleotide adenylyltransferase
MGDSVRLGLLGGTFNPIHFGHLRLAEEIYEDLGLQQVIFIPAAIPPHKDAEEIIPFSHRFDMVDLAIRDCLHFSVSDIEEKLPGKSYSIETLKYLRKIHGEKVAFYFILGIDEFLNICSWKDYRNLFTLCEFVVIDRPGYPASKLPEIVNKGLSQDFSFNDEERRFVHPSKYSIYLRQTTLLDISSTKIREYVSKGKSIRFLTPDVVCDYIFKEGFYR